MARRIWAVIVATAFLLVGCSLDTMGENMFPPGNLPDSGLLDQGMGGADAQAETAPDGPSEADGKAGSAGSGGMGGTAGVGGTSGAGGTIADAGEEDALPDAIPEASPEPLPEASPEAAPDVVEEPAVPETGPDAVEPDVVEPDVVEADADPCPNGGILDNGPADCGQIPTSGLWICVIVPHIEACGTVGVAGANPPLGQAADTYWNDPMVVTGGPCVAVSATEDFVLCKLPAPSTTMVQFAPGLHNGLGPTIPGRFACNSQNCRGRVHVYKDGTEVGGMQNSAASGIVSLVIHQGRLDLTLIAP
ncbi:hypothetical protein HZC53_04970 [Candidatus Uhrbacteria bacterium]|nr:hypothetical protein [Candidatus Uhrbacteria bacterium]